MKCEALLFETAMRRAGGVEVKRNDLNDRLNSRRQQGRRVRSAARRCEDKERLAASSERHAELIALIIGNDGHGADAGRTGRPPYEPARHAPGPRACLDS